MNDAVAPVVEAADVESALMTNAPQDSAAEQVNDSDALDFDFGRLLINLFIIFHVSAIIIWNLPSTPLQSSLANVVKGYMTLTGCWQSWSMFSPDPVSVDTYLGAVIHYKDGSSRQYTFPRIANLGSVDKYRFERWRKFIENTQSSTASASWPYLARYAAIQNNPSPETNPPVAVDLIRYQRMIAPNNEPPLRYLSQLMLTEQVIAMPAKDALHLKE